MIYYLELFARSPFKMSNNISDDIKFQRLFLQVVGLWPEKHPTLYSSIKGKISVIVALAFVFTIAIEIVNIFDNYILLTEHLAFMVSPTSFVIKLLFFIWKRDRFVTLYQKLSLDIFNERPKHMEKVVKRSARISSTIAFVYTTTCALVCVLFCARPFYTTVNMPVRFSFDLGIYKIPMVLFQILGMFHAALSNSSIDVLAMSFMGIATSQIEVMNDKITNFKSTCDESEAGEDDYVPYLNKCVKHHSETIKYVDDIEEVFSFVFLAQYLTSGSLICNIGFQLVHLNGIDLQFINNIFYLAAMMCQLGMYCWYGNEIIVKSEDTRKACYESDWIDCEVKVRKMLIIIMERSKKPLIVTAGKFSVLSLNSFTTIVNTSFSYFAIMQKLYSKTEI